MEHWLIDLSQCATEELHGVLVVFLADQLFCVTVSTIESVLRAAPFRLGLRKFKQSVDFIRRKSIGLAALKDFYGFEVEAVVNGAGSFLKSLRELPLPRLPGDPLREGGLQIE